MILTGARSRQDTLLRGTGSARAGDQTNSSLVKYQQVSIIYCRRGSVPTNSNSVGLLDFVVSTSKSTCVLFGMLRANTACTDHDSGKL